MAAERIFDLRAGTVTAESELQYLPTSEIEAKAAKIAEKAHEGVFRKSGEPYFTHCEAVASILARWGIRDPEIIAAGWVHDVVEDCPEISLQFIEQELSPRVAFIVNGVTKFDAVDSGKDDKRETHQKVLDSQYVDLGVAFVKLADRVHNMSTMDAMSPKKQKEKSRETLQIYAPLAEALGMWDVKNYLEDTAFSYLYPELYMQVRQQIDSDPRLNPDFLAHHTSNVSHMLEERGIDANVNVRVGGYWSLYKKQEKLSSRGQCGVGDFSTISDVVSIRLRTKSEADCYQAIHIIHKELGKYVDYSKYDEYFGENKRENGYEAIQTTLELTEGALEIAVTTEEKEQFNRWGVIQKLTDHQTDMREYQLKSVIIDDGEQETVHFIDSSATGADLAYTLSDVLGASATSIIINGVEMPLPSVLPNAGRVSFNVGKTQRAPKPSLLNYVALPQTKKKIQEQLTMAERDRHVAVGEQKMEQILSSRGFLSIDDIGVQSQSLLNNLELQSLNELYFYLGMGAYSSAVEKWLDRKGVTKEQMKMTTVRVIGHDQSGILAEISSFLTARGGNIKSINLTTNEDEFNLRMVVEKLDKSGEEAIERYLSECNKYSGYKIV